MIISKDKVCGKIRYGIDKIQFNKELKQGMVDYINETFNVPTGTVMDYVAGRLLLNDASTFLLFALATGLDHVNESKIVKKSFSEIEIAQFSSMKYEEEKIKFPLQIKCIQINTDQWIGACDTKMLMMLRDAQLINYNANTQRTMQHIVRGGKEMYRIAINQGAVSSIENLLENNVFIPNTITLNIPETEFDFKYDPARSELIIYSLKYFDITDGYHRYLAMCRMYDRDKEFNYPFELRITNFPEARTRQFIYQEDQKTRMRRIDSDSMNMNAPYNLIVERLNSNIDFYWNGSISRNDGLVNYAELAKVIQFFYYRKSNEIDRRQMFLLEKDLVSKLNYVIGNNDQLMENKVDFAKLMLIFYCISTFDDIKEANKHITNGLQNIQPLTKRTGFINKKPRVGLLKDIREII